MSKNLNFSVAEGKAVYENSEIEAGSDPLYKWHKKGLASTKKAIATSMFFRLADNVKDFVSIYPKNVIDSPEICVGIRFGKIELSCGQYQAYEVLRVLGFLKITKAHKVLMADIKSNLTTEIVKKNLVPKTPYTKKS